MSISPRPPRSTRRLAALVVAAAAGFAVGMTGCTAERAEQATPTPKLDQALHERLPTDIRRTRVLAVATDATYAPASFYAPDGRTVIGFEPDLAAALGAVLGVRIEFVVTDFVHSLDAIRTGRADVVISAMTDTQGRERRADFVNYFRAGTSILVRRGNPHGVAEIGDLCGHVVAVERGTVQVGLLRRGQSRCTERPIVVRTHKTNADALVELRTGRATAVLNDYTPAAYLSSHPRTQGEYQLASTVQYEPGLYGIAVRKDQPQLRDALREGLEHLVATGRYAKILAEWDVTEGAVSTITLNAG